MKKLFKQLVQFSLLSVAVGCSTIISSDDSMGPEEVILLGMDALIVPASFDYATTSNANFSVVALDNQNIGLSGVIFNLLSPDGESWKPIGKGATDLEGKLEFNIPIASYFEHLKLETTYIGLPQEIIVPADQLNGEIVIGGAPSRSSDGITSATNGRFLSGLIPVGEYWLLDDHDNDGVPYNLLEVADHISQDLLDLINSTLPERYPVPVYNPQYLDDDIQTNTMLGDSAEVWVTFVHEGAGWRNTLGYYTYSLDNPPTSFDDIDSMFIVFPNVSFTYSGGDLSSGDKVYLGSFPANTGIGWFLIPQGWNGSQVVNRSQIKYSDKSFNTFTGEAYSQHTVLLKDDAREILLLGMEDTSRPGGDNDFNDAVFYVTASPYSAIITDDLEETQTSGNPDSDGDGVSDTNDDYPDDLDRAFNIYTPSENTYGSLAFEDQWPIKGDYDLNDLVVDYNFKFITNTANKAVSIETKLKVRAVGALFHNGFGIELPIDPGLVSGVSSDKVSVNLAVEQDATNATIMIFEDAHSFMNSSGHINTIMNQAKVDAREIIFTIDFTEPVAMSSLGYAPFNPFITANGDRTVEIHLPDYSPTSKANLSLLGTAHDKSNAGTSVYYKSYNNLPWAINLPESFDYPVEFTSIEKAHLMFKTWAESGDNEYKDWYTSHSGYRSVQKIYE
ncbi:MAG: LruC domain-containing protein [Bacteroidota bacterium]